MVVMRVGVEGKKKKKMMKVEGPGEIRAICEDFFGISTGSTKLVPGRHVDTCQFLMNCGFVDHAFLLPRVGLVLDLMIFNF